MTNEISVVKHLRSNGVRATPQRISVFQAVAAGPQSGSTAEEIYLRMYERGTPVSLGAVYRATRVLEDAGLVSRAWDKARKSIFWIKGLAPAENAIWVRCIETGNLVMLESQKLLEFLICAARAQGLELAGRRLEITVV